MQQSSDTIKGIRVLSFEDTELYKVLPETNSESLIESGPLNVVFFDEFDRFLLFLNLWDYALLKRLSVTSSNPNEVGTRTYTFPSSDGNLILKINFILIIKI